MTTRITQRHPLAFSADVGKQLMEVANTSTCPERDMCVMLLMDEMHIIVYDKHTGTVYIYN